MFDVVLFEPEIPPNTGNIIRLCANTGARLHLVGSLGFSMDDRLLKRAGLDYREFAEVQQHHNLETYLETCTPPRLFALSTKGTRPYTDVTFASDDALLFGPETRGLPDALLSRLDPQQVLRLPMREGSRSLNLSNTVAVVVYEAWRQQGFA